MTTGTGPVTTAPEAQERDPREYLVSWEIELLGASPEDAARGAQDAQRDPRSRATVFTVRDGQTGECWRVDLLAGETERVQPEEGR
jgi:hypothetical protein